MLALSILAVTVSRRSMALSIPVAEKLSGSSLWPSAISGTLDPRPPPAAMAPGPAGLGGTLAAAFFAPAFGAAAFLAGAELSSSARSRAFSAFRASSALRFSSLSSPFLLDFAPSAHLSASRRSYMQRHSAEHRLRLYPMHARRTLSAAAASCFLASFSAFFARPDSFFAFPPLGAIVTEKSV